MLLLSQLLLFILHEIEQRIMEILDPILNHYQLTELNLVIHLHISYLQALHYYMLLRPWHFGLAMHHDHQMI